VALSSMEADTLDDPYVRERILNLALEVGAAASLNQILSRALSRVDELLPFDIAAVALIEPGQDKLAFREMNYRLPGQGGSRSLVGTRIPLTRDNVFGWSCLSGRPHLRRHLSERFPFDAVQATGGEVSSHIIAPIMGHHEVIGALAVGCFKPERYDEVEMAIATQFARLIGMAIDNRQTYEQVSELALRDGLTGAYNHRQFQDVLGRELDRMARYKGQLSLLLVDVDNFKLFNDRYGHPKGDEVLRRTVSLMEQSLRTSDLVFRYGGEEFAVLLPATHEAAAREVGEKLLEVMRKKNRYDCGTDGMVPVTVSIGQAVAVDGEPNREALIQAADKALYQAKQAGKDCVIAAGQ